MHAKSSHFRTPTGLVSILLLLSVGLATRSALAAPVPLKPHAQVVEEVIDFLFSDVGNGGIRTYDNDPLGEPAPPYFYHFAIQHDDDLWSRTGGYPYHASISYPGYTASVAIDAFLAWWSYSGEQEGLDRAVQMADWILDRRTPATDLYGNWPYSTQTDGVMGGGFDGEAIMSDKPAMFALRCLRLHRITGESRFLDGALEIADTYVTTQMSGGPADDGRWPFRVRPSDGLVTQDYTTHLIPAVRLLEQLEADHPGQGYGAAAGRAMAWLEANPLNPASPDYMHWEGFYEDVTPEEMVGDHDHYSAEETLLHLLDRSEIGDLQHAIEILDWSTARYEAPYSQENGYDAYAPVTLEWDHWPHSTYAATGQWAWVQLRLDRAAQGSALHDPLWRTRAIEALHTLTYGQGYFAPPGGDGRMLTTVRELTDPAFLPQTWYEQNFNTVKYLLLAFGLAPELAPADQDHLLAHESGELRSVEYVADRITLEWDGPGTALFKLASEPYGVLLGGGWIPEASSEEPLDRSWRWDPAAQLLELDHDGESTIVVLSAGPGTDAPVRRPLGLTVGPARPQPFNPRTVIPFRTVREGYLRLEIYDARGRRIRTLLEGTHPAGLGRAVWDGTDDQGRAVSSGVFHAVLRNRGERASTALVLVR